MLLSCCTREWWGWGGGGGGDDDDDDDDDDVLKRFCPSSRHNTFSNSAAVQSVMTAICGHLAACLVQQLLCIPVRKPTAPPEECGAAAAAAAAAQHRGLKPAC